MKPDGALKLLAEVRDLQIVDSEGRRCGIVDDLEFEGGPGKSLKVRAILVGPGAWRERLPGWAWWIVRHVTGERITRVPWSKVKRITSMVVLDARGEAVGLRKVEDALGRKLPRIPAL
jgi:sporulation protein YlmC with PRC-barrel domain